MGRARGRGAAPPTASDRDRLAVLPPDRAESVADLADRGVGVGSLDERRHEVDLRVGRFLGQPGENAVDGGLIALVLITYVPQISLWSMRMLMG